MPQLGRHFFCLHRFFASSTSISTTASSRSCFPASSLTSVSLNWSISAGSVLHRNQQRIIICNNAENKPASMCSALMLCASVFLLTLISHTVEFTCPLPVSSCLSCLSLLSFFAALPWGHLLGCTA